MLNLKNLGRTAVATLLGAGLFVSAGINPASAGKGGPGGEELVWSESGFDFFLFSDEGDSDVPFFIGNPAAVGFPFAADSGVLGFCPACDDDIGVLGITRPDGALFSMTGFVGGSFDDIPDTEGPVPSGLPGVEFNVVADEPPTPILAAGLLTPGPSLHLFDPATPPVAELFIFSPAPHDLFDGEAGDCLCFDSMSFDVFFDIETPGPKLVAIESITVSFNVPEPGALSLLGIGLAGLAVMRRRRRRSIL